MGIHYCIYLFEENKKAKKAYEISNKYYEKVMKLLSNIKNSHETHLELNNILFIMKQNIDNWKYIMENFPEESEDDDNNNKKAKEIKK